MKILPIEGNRQKLDGGAMFGNVPKAMWEKWLKPNEKNQIELAARALLYQTNEGRNILFETGIGAFFDPKLKERYGITPEEHVLIQNLRKVGVEESDIDAVILSHLHFDHAGGLLPQYGDEPPRLHFPNANYYVSRAHWEFSLNPHPREKASFIPILQELLIHSDRLVLVEEESHPDLPKEISFRFSDGHTRGLMLSVIALEERPLIFVSDLIPGFPWVHLPIAMGYDRFPERKIDEKQALYKAFADEQPLFFFTHDPEEPFGVLVKDEDGKFRCEVAFL